MGQLILVQEEPLSCFETIETPILVADAGKFRIPMQDSQQLRSDTTTTIIIKAIRITVPGKLTFGPITGLAIAPVAELQKLTMTIYAEGWEKGHNMPVLNFNDVIVPGGTEPYRNHTSKLMDWTKVDWPKSFYQFSNGSGGAVPGAAGYCIMMEVEYVRMDSRGVAYTGPNL